MFKFFMFDILILPWIIRWVYVLGELAILFIGLKMLGEGEEKKLFGLLLIIGGSIVLRLFLESVIVLFKISSDLAVVKNSSLLKSNVQIVNGIKCKCGMLNTADSKFCRDCGEKLNDL